MEKSAAANGSASRKAAQTTNARGTFVLPAIIFYLKATAALLKTPVHNTLALDGQNISNPPSRTGSASEGTRKIS
jgi:hypothetical protein